MPPPASPPSTCMFWLLPNIAGIWGNDSLRSLSGDGCLFQHSVSGKFEEAQE